MYVKYKTYLKLHESCDSVELYNKTLNFGDVDAITFIVYNNKIYKSDKDTHLDIFMKNSEIYNNFITDIIEYLKEEYKLIISEDDLIQNFSNGNADKLIGLWLHNCESFYLGRLWTKSKVISYWRIPKTLKMFNLFLKLIEFDTKIKFNDKWSLDYYDSDGIIGDIISDPYSDLQFYHYSNFDGDYYTITFDYLESVYDELNTDAVDDNEILRHLNTTTKNPVPDGFGSKNPKKKSLEYKQLLYQESCDKIALDRKNLLWYKKEVLPFIIYGNNIYFGTNDETHAGILIKNDKLWNKKFLNYIINEIEIEHDETISSEDIISYIKNELDVDTDDMFISLYNIGEIISNFYRIYGFSGRLWKDNKIISFWKNPKDYSELQSILKIIENNTDVKFDQDWRLDLYVSEDDDLDLYTENDIDTYQLNDETVYALIPFEKLSTIYDDVDVSKTDDEGFKRHLNTATKNPVPDGFGSKNPKKKSLEYKQLLYQEKYKK